jgi:outer membrane protein TolC
MSVEHERIGRRHRAWAVALCGCACVIAGCSSDYYRRKADAEVYDIIEKKTPQVPDMPRNFRLPESGARRASAGEAAGRALSLPDALRLAIEHNRQYQSAREDVYLQAMSLTESRLAFSNQYTGIVDLILARDGTRTSSAGADSTSADSTVESSGSLGLTRRLSTGGQLTTSLSANFLRYLTGDPRNSAAAAFDAALRQPLWRGAGRRNAQEGLIQAERDTTYQLRDFVRFRRTFYVRVASDYYRVLQQEAVVGNERVNLENLGTARQRAEMLAQAGRLPEFQVRQAEQDELSARDRWVRAVQAHEAARDSFKITLGVPTETELQLDPQELARLQAAELPETALTRDAAVEQAARSRLDLLTAADEVDDAERKVAVAENNLKPDLDLLLGFNTQRSRSRTTSGVTRTWDSGVSAGVEADLPLTRLPERNDYRAAFVSLDRVRRAHSLLSDQVVQQIYSAWRRLEEARESRRIQVRSVELAERRVESTTMLLDAGRAEVRDLLEAQAALLRARNALLAVLVDYRVALLELWRDMDRLAFENGEFREESPDESGRQI